MGLLIRESDLLLAITCQSIIDGLVHDARRQQGTRVAQRPKCVDRPPFVFLEFFLVLLVIDLALFFFGRLQILLLDFRGGFIDFHRFLGFRLGRCRD